MEISLLQGWDRSSHPEVFCKKGVLRNLAKIHRKTPVPELLSDAVVFMWNFAKFLRKPFLTEHLRWLLLLGNARYYWSKHITICEKLSTL